MSPLQKELQDRKQKYLAALVNRYFLKKPGWDVGLKPAGGEKSYDSYVQHGPTYCDILNFKDKPIDAVEKMPKIVPPKPPPQPPQPPPPPSPGIDPEGVENMPHIKPEERYNTDDSIEQAIARVEISRNDPNVPFGIPSNDIHRYWSTVNNTYEVNLLNLNDNADFALNEVIRVVYLYGEIPKGINLDFKKWRDSEKINEHFSSIADQSIKKTLKQFKFWMDDSMKVEDQKGSPNKTEMTFWSENHQILFPTGEYLTGQLFPDDIFETGKSFRDPHKEFTDLKGSEHMQKASVRIHRWLNERLKFGFSEWNAPGYYQEHFMGLFNLADFCLDEVIRKKACMVLDLMIFDLARFTHEGSFSVTAGRAYYEHKSCYWEQSVGDIIELLFGTRGWFTDHDSQAATFLATSSGYEVPDVLIAIGQDKIASSSVDRSRVSIDFNEAEDYGIGFDSDEDVIFWWGRLAYFVKQLIDKTRSLTKKYGLQKTEPFSKVLGPTKLYTIGKDVIWGAVTLANPVVGGAVALLGGGALNPFSGESGTADAFSLLTEGPSLTRANMYTYRGTHSMLSSVQNFRSGHLTYQTHVCVATLENGATVWTTHPSHGDVLGATNIHDGPNWWTGSVTVPRVIQMNNAAIIIYRPKMGQWILFGSRTHAWFPKNAFDESKDNNNFDPLEAFNNNFESGRWVFGKVGDGYIGLYSAQTPEWTKDGPWTDKELTAEGKNNVFIIQTGTKEEYGEFSDFINKVRNARIHINGIHLLSTMDTECSYDIPRTFKQISDDGPGSDRLELHYDDDQDEVRIDGQPFEDSGFPRFENKYLTAGRVLWQQFNYTIKHLNYSLTHDFRSLKYPAFMIPEVQRFIDSMEYSPALIEQLQSSRQYILQGKGTTATPSLASAGYGNFTASTYNLYMAWKGGKDDSGLYWAYFDGNKWTPQYNIEGMGSSDGPALANLPDKDGYASGLVMAWKGIEGDSAIYYSFNDSLNQNGWESQEKVKGTGTSCKPALAYFNEKIYLVWKGIDGDSGIYFSRYINNSWMPQEKIKGIGTTSSPSLVVCKKRLYLFWKGIERDSDIYYSRLKENFETEWEDQQVIAFKSVGGSKTIKVGTSHSPYAASVGDVIFLTWKGIEGDSGIYFSTYEHSEWSGQVKIKGIGSACGPAVGVLRGNLFMVWRGIDDKGLFDSGFFKDDDHNIYSCILSQDTKGGNGGIYFKWHG